MKFKEQYIHTVLFSFIIILSFYGLIEKESLFRLLKSLTFIIIIFLSSFIMIKINKYYDNKEKSLEVIQHG